MSGQQTATDVALHLARLSRELDEAVSELARLDEEAVRAKATYEVAYSRALLQAEGSNADTRKANAVVKVADQSFAAEIAAQRVRAARERISALKTRIDVGRSMGAAVRAEVSLAGSGMAP